MFGYIFVIEPSNIPCKSVNKKVWLVRDFRISFLEWCTYFISFDMFGDFRQTDPFISLQIDPLELTTVFTIMR